MRILQVIDYPALHVDVDRQRAAQAGLTQRDVANNLLVSLSSSALVSPSFWLNPKNSVNYTVVVQDAAAPRSPRSSDVLATPLTAAGSAVDRIDQRRAAVGVPRARRRSC